VIDEGARVGTPQTRVGLFPFVITAVLQRQTLRRPLLEMMLLGNKIDAQRAVSMGLANRVSAPGAALEEAMALAATLAARSRAVLALGKMAFHRAADLSYDDALAFLNGRLTVNLLMDDAKEGIHAFLERRRAVWQDR
jgi:enoyl-CoA hydratase/carnithine racemase